MANCLLEGNHRFEGSYVICEARTPTYPRPPEWNSLTQSSGVRILDIRETRVLSHGWTYVYIYIYTYVCILYIYIHIHGYVYTDNCIYIYQSKYHVTIFIYMLHSVTSKMTIMWMLDICVFIISYNVIQISICVYLYIYIYITWRIIPRIITG